MLVDEESTCMGTFCTIFLGFGWSMASKYSVPRRGPSRWLARLWLVGRHNSSACIFLAPHSPAATGRSTVREYRKPLPPGTVASAAPALAAGVEDWTDGGWRIKC